MDSIGLLESRIKQLKIQGATDIALAVLSAVDLVAENKTRKDDENIGRYLYRQISRLAYARPTEPLAQNALRFILDNKNDTLKNYLVKKSQYEYLIKDSKYKMSVSGASLIENGATYLTHCHSSTVVSMFIHAGKKGKQFSVIVPETRPKFQGRITASQLLSNGLSEIYMIIDDVAASVILDDSQKVTAVFIGCDLLSEKGFVNKVGSLGIVYCANEKKIPVYCLSLLLKYDPQPYTLSLIEKRNSSEIWSDAPRELKFITPAFDFIPYYENVTVISEAGSIKGSEVKQAARTLYPFLFKDKG